MTEYEGSAIALSEDSRGRNTNEVDSEAVVSKLSTTALDALAAVSGSEVQTPETTPHQEQQSVNPTPSVQHQLIDEPSEETLEPSPIASQHTEPLGTPVNNPSENMTIDSHVDEAPPQFSPRTVEQSPSINHVSPVHTATTLRTTVDAQDEDDEVDMTSVKRRTVSKKKLKAKKKQKQVKEVEVAEDTEVEGISPPKRITRQGAQSMAQPKGPNRTDLQNSRSTSRRSKDRLMRFTNNPRPPSVIEAVEEMKNTILGEVQKATTKLKKTFKERTDKLKGKINEL
ncbi:hypothetical protein L6452_00521 [Arctium lappa]|uniref:Uncharacterized protein n=1 Tax=Arctium lappa TaxID=4217 RepID=A0ACB9FDM5_ARCLA|nr:hypothetical protein L6452_00521 [Arctium lappa]